MSDMPDVCSHEWIGALVRTRTHVYTRARHAIDTSHGCACTRRYLHTRVRIEPEVCSKQRIRNGLMWMFYPSFVARSVLLWSTAIRCVRSAPASPAIGHAVGVTWKDARAATSFHDPLGLQGVPHL